jgi:hypothetical protein
MTRTAILLGIAAASLVGMVVVVGVARSDDAPTVGGGARPGPGRTVAEEQELESLARAMGGHLFDFEARTSHAEGVTNEEFEESLRMRAEADGPERRAAAVDALRRRLRTGVADRERRRAAEVAATAAGDRSEPASASEIAIVEDQCRAFCTLLLRCRAHEEAGDWTTCLEVCGRGEYGSLSAVASAVEVNSCDHL